MRITKLAPPTAVIYQLDIRTQIWSYRMDQYATFDENYISIFHLSYTITLISYVYLHFNNSDFLIFTDFHFDEC